MKINYKISEKVWMLSHTYLCRRTKRLVSILALSLSLFLAPEVVANAIPYFPAASDPLGRQGFVRVVNLSDSAGQVSITAWDDGGRKHGPVTLSLDALQTKHFNSGDLEDGAVSKGLPTGIGAPTSGDWRLKLSSDLNINVLSYIRTSDGFVTSMHDMAPSDGNTHHVAFFNPGSNFRQESLLRLVNPSDATADVTINAMDDSGAKSASSVTLKIVPDGAAILSAADLEEGTADLEGSLGDGAGKWRLTVSANHAIMAMSMLSTPTGHLTNLSTVPSDFRLPSEGGGPTGGGGPVFGRLSTGSFCPAPSSDRGCPTCDIVVDNFTVSNLVFHSSGLLAYFDYSVTFRNCSDEEYTLSFADDLYIYESRSEDPSIGGKHAIDWVDVPKPIPPRASSREIKVIDNLISRPDRGNTQYVHPCFGNDLNTYNCASPIKITFN